MKNSERVHIGCPNSSPFLRKKNKNKEITQDLLGEAAPVCVRKTVRRRRNVVLLHSPPTKLSVSSPKHSPQSLPLSLPLSLFP